MPKVIQALKQRRLEIDFCRNRNEAYQKLGKQPYEIMVVSAAIAAQDSFQVIERGLNHGIFAVVVDISDAEWDFETEIASYKKGAADCVRIADLDGQSLCHALWCTWERFCAMQHHPKLQEQVDLLTAAIEEGIFDWHLIHDSVDFSIQWARMLGYEKKEISNSPQEWFGRIHPKDSKRIRLRLDEHLMGKTPAFSEQYRILHRDGSYRRMAARGVARLDETGKAVRMIGSQADITEQTAMDLLTGLANQVALHDCLDDFFADQALDEGETPALALCVIDNFQRLNHGFGRIAGDNILLECARRIKNLVPTNDLVARVGAAEFAIVLGDAGDSRDLYETLVDLQKECQEPFEHNGRTINITVKLSASYLERTNPVATHEHATLALQHATFGNPIVLFGADMRAKAERKLLVETRFRKALENHELTVAFQPILDMQQGHAIGFEALARWQHHELGAVSPGEFVPIAEECGLVQDMGDLILDKVCEHIAGWEKQFSLSETFGVNVNLSGAQFENQDLADKLLVCLSNHGLDTSKIKLELTESMLMENVSNCRTQLTRLKDLGFSLIIDDFGTGYSSLEYLSHFPVDGVKIDRSFVRDMLTNARSKKVVAAVISLAKSLELFVTAEGIEEEEQQVMLQDLGCDFAQGFLFCKPVQADKAIAYAIQKPQA